VFYSHNLKRAERDQASDAPETRHQGFASDCPKTLPVEACRRLKVTGLDDGVPSGYLRTHGAQIVKYAPPGVLLPSRCPPCSSSRYAHSPPPLFGPP